MICGQQGWDGVRAVCQDRKKKKREETDGVKEEGQRGKKEGERRRAYESLELATEISRRNLPSCGLLPVRKEERREER